MRREMVGPFEPDLIVDPSKCDAVEAVKEFTKGVGADIVICANPVAQTQSQAVNMVRKAGKIFLFGGLPKAEPMTTLDSNVIHYGEIEVIGAFSYHPTMHELALDLLSQGAIPADLLITHTFELMQIDEAYDTASSGKALKVLITVEKERS
ncbi:MAG: zinc-binding dehydrogenase [Planctomycetota bacterium]|jgi:L-iditol 2-dehydrogenase